jgi:type IV secretory pathway ATPase VirB11/archaellum biosynthesis ATPase
MSFGGLLATYGGAFIRLSRVQVMLLSRRREGAKERASWLLLDLFAKPPPTWMDRYRSWLFEIYLLLDSDRTVLYHPTLSEKITQRLPLIRRTLGLMNRDDFEIDVSEYEWRSVYESIRSRVLAMLGSEADPDLASLVALEYMGIVRLAPFVVDEHVSDVFCDGPLQALYLDHKVYGRCTSTVRLTERETVALQTLTEAFSGLSATYLSPSLKSDAWIVDRRVRLSIDTAPLCYSGFCFVMRKAGFHQHGLSDLCRGGTITPEAAAFLLAVLETGGNITILGPPGSGKTTLLNALDAYIPAHRRRVYIEDAVETQDLVERGYRQLKLVVEPFDSTTSARLKTSEILKVLHRSPDIVILGEIQSSEHSRALFQALAAGLPCIETFHATSPEQAVRRWVNIHGIPVSALEDLDCLVTMARPSPDDVRRVVSRISEINIENGMVWVNDVFVRGPGGLVAIKSPDKTQASLRVRNRGHGRPFLEVYHQHLEEICRLTSVQCSTAPVYDLAPRDQSSSEIR